MLPQGCEWQLIGLTRLMQLQGHEWQGSGPTRLVLPVSSLRQRIPFSGMGRWSVRPVPRPLHPSLLVCSACQGGAVRNELFKVLDAEGDMLLKEGIPSNEGRRASR